MLERPPGVAVQSLLPATAASVRGSVGDFLECSIASGDVERFLNADARVWSAFLSAQPGVMRKHVLLNPRDAAAQLVNGEGFYLPSAATNCGEAVCILWESRALWKSIPPQLLSAAPGALRRRLRLPARAHSASFCRRLRCRG
jgi:hypothetical protein